MMMSPAVLLRATKKSGFLPSRSSSGQAKANAQSAAEVRAADQELAQPRTAEGLDRACSSELAGSGSQGCTR